MSRETVYRCDRCEREMKHHERDTVELAVDGGRRVVRDVCGECFSVIVRWFRCDATMPPFEEKVKP